MKKKILIIQHHSKFGGASKSISEFVSVRDRLYEPVKRENKIRVVRISAANIVVSGF